MYGVDLYGLVRRMVMRDGVSHREAARRFGIDRGTVAKMVKHPVPPGYQRKIPVHRPKLADHVDFIEQVLDADETAPAKQRHTARRLFERLRGRAALRRELLDGARLRALATPGAERRCSFRWRILPAMPRRTLARRS
jgi:hypothetical protein